MLVPVLGGVMHSCHALAVPILCSAKGMLRPLCSLHTQGTLGGFLFPATPVPVAEPNKDTQSHFSLEKGCFLESPSRAIGGLIGIVCPLSEHGGNEYSYHSVFSLCVGGVFCPVLQ